MEIFFHTSRIRKICENDKLAIKKLGDICAKSLRNRLADLEAAETVGELLAGNPHPLKGNRKGQIAVNLTGGVRLIFKQNQAPHLNQPIDWREVREIRIIDIGDYHG